MSVESSRITARPGASRSRPLFAFRRVLHPSASIDYIHGEESVRRLAARGDAVGFLFSGMRKDELFAAVRQDGSLPRKTFSMDHADDKRFYLEARRLISE